MWAASLLLLAVPFAYQALGEWRDRRRYPPPGVMTNGLHVWKTGPAGGPTVVLEAGIAGSSLSWKPVQDLVSGFASVASYDRAGLGWSDAVHAPVSLESMLAGLRGLALPGPYVLVGHSFGGLLVQHYAATHPADVCALVLVDPVPVRHWHPLSDLQAARLRRGISLSRRGAILARLGVVRLALDLLVSGARLLPRLLARAAAGNGATVTGRLTAEVRKLPPEVLPMVRALWCLPKCFFAMAAYLEALPACAAQGKKNVDIPTIVLTPELVECEIPAHAEHRIARKSAHWIQLDEPELVAQAIQDALRYGNKR